MQKQPIIEEVPSQDLRDAEDEMPLGYVLEHMYAEPFPELHDPLLVAGRTKMTPFAGEGQEVLVVAVFAFDEEVCEARQAPAKCVSEIE
jgi:hypothetical protein